MLSLLLVLCYCINMPIVIRYLLYFSIMENFSFKLTSYGQIIFKNSFGKNHPYAKKMSKRLNIFIIIVVITYLVFHSLISLLQSRSIPGHCFQFHLVAWSMKIKKVNYHPLQNRAILCITNFTVPINQQVFNALLNHCVC